MREEKNRFLRGTSSVFRSNLFLTLIKWNKNLHAGGINSASSRGKVSRDSGIVWTRYYLVWMCERFFTSSWAGNFFLRDEKFKKSPL